MAASDNINDQQFYHGTWAGWMKKGQLITPASSREGYTNFSMSSPNHVYVTKDPELARGWAEMVYEGLEKQGHVINNIPVVGAKPVVYKVEPQGNVEQDPNFRSGGESYRVRGNARIISRHWEGDSGR